MQATLVQQSKTYSMKKVFLIIGKASVESFDNGLLDEVTDVREYLFHTDGEANAFRKGVRLTSNYSEYSFITEEEFNQIKNV